MLKDEECDKKIDESLCPCANLQNISQLSDPFVLDLDETDKAKKFREAQQFVHFPEA